MENDSFPFCGLFPERNKIKGNQVSFFSHFRLFSYLFLWVLFILFHLSAHNLESCQRQNPTGFIAFKRKRQPPVIADQLPVLILLRNSESLTSE